MHQMLTPGDVDEDEEIHICHLALFVSLVTTTLHMSCSHFVEEKICKTI